MPQQVPITIPTGKNNMLGSLLQYLVQYLPLAVPGPTGLPQTTAYAVNLEQFEEAAVYPSMSIEDIGMPGLGAYAFDSFMGKYVDDNGDTKEFYGKVAHTLVEFNLQANANDVGNAGARQQVYQMFDQLDFLLRNTGEIDHNGDLMLPPIPLMNLDTNPISDTPCKVWCPTEKDSIMFPTYVGTDPERPGIKRLSLRARIQWEMQEIPSVTV